MIKYPFTTRIYELDRFAHINNSNYLRFLEEARAHILEKIKDSQERKPLFQVKKIDAYFKRQVVNSEEMEVLSIPIDVQSDKIVLRQEIRKISDASLCFEADVYLELLNEKESLMNFWGPIIQQLKPTSKPEAESFKTVKFPIKGKHKRLAKKIPIQVRPYEIDSTGKLNPSVYSNYFEFGRWKYLENVDALGDIMEKDHIGLILYRSTFEIFGEAVMFDQLNLHTRISELSLLKMFFYHELYSNSKKLIARARAELCCISPTGRPIKIPEPVYEFLKIGLK